MLRCAQHLAADGERPFAALRVTPSEAVAQSTYIVLMARDPSAAKGDTVWLFKLSRTLLQI